jgi:class 3 adenylate cyclase
VPAALDARSAVFASVDAAVAAAIAIARDLAQPGRLPAGIGLASGTSAPGEFGAWGLYHRARGVAELAEPGGIVLAASTVECIAGAIPEGATLGDLDLRQLPDLHVVDRPVRPSVSGRAARLIERFRRTRMESER